MQTQGLETDGITISTGHFICKQANDFDTLALTVAAAAAAYIVTNPDAQLIDISLAGAGAGNVFMATLLFTPGNVENDPAIRYSNMATQWFQAPDMATLESKLNAYLLTLGAGVALYAWETSCAGNGAIWIAVLVTFTPSGIG